jgi:hypothetical protein
MERGGPKMSPLRGSLNRGAALYCDEFLHLLLSLCDALMAAVKVRWSAWSGA